MADTGNRGLITIGVFLIIVVVSILLYQPLKIIDWTLILPMIIVLSGCWLAILGGLRYHSPQKYERGPLSTASWGLFLAAIGIAWFVYGYGWYYSLAIILLALAVLTIASALRRK